MAQAAAATLQQDVATELAPVSATAICCVVIARVWRTGHDAVIMAGNQPPGAGLHKIAGT